MQLIIIIGSYLFRSFFESPSFAFKNVERRDGLLGRLLQLLRFLFLVLQRLDGSRRRVFCRVALDHDIGHFLRTSM